MRKFILFLSFFSLFSAGHVSANKSEWNSWFLCVQKGHTVDTQDFRKCVKEQEDRVKRQKEFSNKRREEFSRKRKDLELKINEYGKKDELSFPLGPQNDDRK